MTSAPDPALLEVLAAALAPLPTLDGGAMLVLATGDGPPAIAVLSTGDVALVGSELRVAVHAGSSASTRLAGSCSLLVPDRDEAYRVEVSPASTRKSRELTVISGPIVSIRPTAEPPWVMRATFHAAGETGDEAAGYVSFWAEVRAWLESGAEGDGPPLPPPTRNG